MEAMTRGRLTRRSEVMLVIWDIPTGIIALRLNDPISISTFCGT